MRRADRRLRADRPALRRVAADDAAADFDAVDPPGIAALREQRGVFEIAGHRELAERPVEMADEIATGCLRRERRHAHRAGVELLRGGRGKDRVARIDAREIAVDRHLPEVDPERLDVADIGHAVPTGFRFRGDAQIGAGLAKVAGKIDEAELLPLATFKRQIEDEIARSERPVADRQRHHIAIRVEVGDGGRIDEDGGRDAVLQLFRGSGSFGMRESVGMFHGFAGSVLHRNGIARRASS